MWNSEVFKLLATEKMNRMMHEVQQDQLVRRATARLPRRASSAATEGGELIEPNRSELAPRGVWATLAYLLGRLARMRVSGYPRALSQPIQRR